MTQTDHDVPVAGAGPAGLATAVAAARNGARVLLVERSPTLSSYPRATRESTRTVEILRTWGPAGSDLVDDHGLTHRCGLGAESAVLVRPDRHCGPGLPAVGVGHLAALTAAVDDALDTARTPVSSATR